MNQSNKEFLSLRDNPVFLSQFLDTDLYAFSKENSSNEISMEETAKPMPPVMEEGPVSLHPVSVNPKGKRVAIWSHEALQDDIKEYLLKILGAAKIEPDECYYWSEAHEHPAVLASASDPVPEVVLVFAEESRFPKLRSDQIIHHENVDFIRGPQLSLLQQSIDGRKVLWKHLQTRFLSQ